MKARLLAKALPRIVILGARALPVGLCGVSSQRITATCDLLFAYECKYRYKYTNFHYLLQFLREKELLN